MGAAILISDKIGFKSEKVTRDKTEQYIIIKETIHQEDTIVINIYEPIKRAPKYLKQLLTDLKGETDSNTIILGDFKTSLIPVDRSSRQKVNKETAALSGTLDQKNFYRFTQRIPSKCSRIHILLKCTWIFSRIDHMLGHKTNLNKFKKTEILSSLFSDHSGMKLEINQKKKAGKVTNMWRQNNILLNNYWVNEEIKKEIKKIHEDK